MEPGGFIEKVKSEYPLSEIMELQDQAILSPTAHNAHPSDLYVWLKHEEVPTSLVHHRNDRKPTHNSSDHQTEDCQGDFHAGHSAYLGRIKFTWFHGYLTISPFSFLWCLIYFPGSVSIPISFELQPMTPPKLN